MRNGARLAQPDCCSDSDQRAARPRERRRKSPPQGARLPAGCCIPRPAAAPRSPASWHAALAASSASTVSSRVCSSTRCATAAGAATTVRAATAGPAISAQASTRRPPAQPGVQLDGLPQHRPPGPGHVPAQGGLTRRLPGAAEHDQLVPFDRRVRGQRKLDGGRRPGCPGRRSARRDRRSGRPLRPGPRGSTAPPRRRAVPALSHAGAGRARSVARAPARSRRQSDRSSPASGPAAEPTRRSSHRSGSSPRTCRSVSGGAQLSSPSTPPAR